MHFERNRCTLAPRWKNWGTFLPPQTEHDRFYEVVPYCDVNFFIQKWEMQNCWNLRFCLLRILTCKFLTYQIALYLVRVVKLNSMLCCRMFINNISHEMLIHKKGSDNSLRPAVILCLSKQCLTCKFWWTRDIRLLSKININTADWCFSSGLIRDTLDPNGTLKLINHILTTISEITIYL